MANWQILYFPARHPYSEYLIVLGRLRMAKLRYTRDQMEEIILRQLENMEDLGEQNRLLKKQNELLEKKVETLKDKLSDKRRPKPYPKISVLRTRKIKTSMSLVADQHLK